LRSLLLKGGRGKKERGKDGREVEERERKGKENPL